MITPFLSQTIPGLPETPAIDQAGAWEAHGAQELEGVAKATKVSEADLKELAQSVPSVWGYARLFFKAWEDPDHSHHSRVIELWRRFVCLVALRKLLPNQSITLARIDLPSGRGGAGARSFKDAAALQWPHDILGTRRDEPVTIAAVMHDGQAIGLLLPGMMALPSRRLIDPATSPLALARDFPLERLDMPQTDRPGFYRRYLTEERLMGLEGFLQYCRDTLRGWRNPTPTLLSDRLARFHMDVVQGLQPKYVAGAASWTPTTESLEWGLPDHSTLRLFHVTWKRDRKVSPTAAVQLRQDLKLFSQQNMPELVLLAPDVKEPRYRELTIDGHYLIRDLVDSELSPQLREQLAQSGESGGILVVSEQELFEPALIRFATNARYPQHPDKLDQYLLPMTPLALAIFGPRGLRERLSISSESPDEVKFILRVTLKGPADLDVSLSRTYRRNAGDIIDAAVPTSFAIWPDFSIPDVDDEESAIPTMVYQAWETPRAGEADSASQFRALHMLSGTSLQDQVQSFLKDVKARSGPVRLRPNADGPGSVIPMLEGHDIVFTAEAGEALQCGADKRVGLLLIDQRKRTARADPAVNCTISIDFGTSSTTLAYLRDGKPAEGDLRPHVWLPFHEAEVTAAQASLEVLRKTIPVIALISNFIPPVVSLAVPFLSILQVRNQIKPSRQEPMLRGRIPFPRETGTENVTTMILEPTPGTEIAVNLKWEGDKDRRELVRHFLREVMLLALGHARGLGCAPQNVSWRMSWPLTMPKETESRFREDAKAAFQTAMGVAPTAERLLFYPESEAIYWYLIHRELQVVASVTAILDIGGRSTDMAILNDGHPCSHGSLDLAGRVLLVKFWENHWKEFCDLAGSLPGSPITGADQAVIGEEQRMALVEILLNDQNHILEEFIRNEGAGKTHALLRATRLRVQFGFLALVYFLVYHRIATLSERRQLNLTRGVALFLCGNGSKLFALFCQDSFDRQVNFKHRAEQWLLDVGFDKPDFVFSLTAQAKMEVAIGGLHWRELAREAEDTSRRSTGTHGFAEHQESWSSSRPPRATTRGTIEDFLAEVKDYFGALLPAFYGPGFLKSIRARSDVPMALPDLFPAFVGSEGFDGPPDQDPRRRFALDINAILAEWKTAETPR